MSDRWEICHVAMNAKWFEDGTGKGEAWYEAKIMGPNGRRTGYQSAKWPLDSNYAEPYVPLNDQPKVAAAHDSVIQQLLADGWEPMQDSQFRRPVRN